MGHSDEGVLAKWSLADARCAEPTGTGSSVDDMSERFANALPSAWQQLPEDEHRRYSKQFYNDFDFRANTSPEGWPAVKEPADSVTYDLSVIPDGPKRGAAYDAINAEALRAFVWAMPEVEKLLVLDWQHPSYWFDPKVQALTWRAEWEVPVYPDGDYFSFLTPDFSEGTFGHPWEQTICVFGERLVGSLGLSLGGWLPTKRVGGHPRD